jgi:H+/Cl- antiporter ClcA
MGQRRRMAIFGSWLGIALISLVFLATAHACAVCVGTGDHGYFWGVLFLMAMPFTVGGFIGGWLLYHYRRAQAGRVTPAPTATVERHMPRPASLSSASERPHGEPQAHHA